jgi:hypothetical protein
MSPRGDYREFACDLSLAGGGKSRYSFMANVDPVDPVSSS